MTKTQLILATLQEPHTRAQLVEKHGGAASAITEHLERKGVVKRSIHKRSESERKRQQRTYINLFVATGKPYAPTGERDSKGRFI